MQELFYQFSCVEPRSESERALRDAFENVARCALDPKLDKIKLEEELVSNLMNILILAAELGLDLDGGIEHVLAELENKARGSLAS